MGLSANTQYFTKVLIVDKQGNQVINSQVAVTTDGVHNADIHPDLAQNFRVHNGGAITLPVGANGNQVLKYTTSDWLSGTCSYANATGLFTAGVAGKFLFRGQAEISGLVSPTGLAMRLALKQNGALSYMGPNAAGTVDAANTGATTYSFDAEVVGSLNLAANDTVGLWVYWIGMTGQNIIASPNCFFEGQVLPG